MTTSYPVKPAMSSSLSLLYANAGAGTGMKAGTATGAGAGVGAGVAADEFPTPRFGFAALCALASTACVVACDNDWSSCCGVCGVPEIVSAGKLELYGSCSIRKAGVNRVSEVGRLTIRYSRNHRTNRTSVEKL